MVSHDDGASISRFGWLDYGGVAGLDGSQFPNLVFFILVFVVVGGCRLRSGRGRLLVCSCSLSLSLSLMWFVVVVGRGNGGGVVAIGFCGYCFFFYYYYYSNGLFILF